MTDVNLNDFENLNNHAPGEWGVPASAVSPEATVRHGGEGEWVRAPEPSKGTRTGAKVGGLIALVAVIGGGVWWYRRNKAAKEE
jgi:hypothetical protein